MNYFITLNIETDLSKEEIGTLLMKNIISGINVVGIEGITPWKGMSTHSETVCNIQNALKQHKKKLRF